MKDQEKKFQTKEISLETNSNEVNLNSLLHRELKILQEAREQCLNKVRISKKDRKYFLKV